jgi:hypothetical protein
MGNRLILPRCELDLQVELFLSLRCRNPPSLSGFLSSGLRGSTVPARESSGAEAPREQAELNGTPGEQGGEG